MPVLLFYEFGSDDLERRPQYRAHHLTFAGQAHDRGELVLAGALGDPVDGAILVFSGDPPALAERFARADTYVNNGVVTRWRVRPWTTAVGEAASSPVRPNQ